MKRLSLAFFMCVALLAAPQSALAIAQVTSFAPVDTGISAALLTSSPAMTLRVSGAATLTFYIGLTRAGATALTIACTAGPTTTMQAPIAVNSVNATTGLMTLVDGTFTWTGISTTRNFRGLINPLNDNLLVCTFTGAGATSDTISVWARSVGQP